MHISKLIGSMALGAAAALVPLQSGAFTSQLPIGGFEFAGPLNVVAVAEGMAVLEPIEKEPLDEGPVAAAPVDDDDVEDVVLYEGSDNRIAVVTDIYLSAESDGEGDHSVSLYKNNSESVENARAGEFVIEDGDNFHIHYTSGVVFIEGEDIVLREVGEGPVTVNLVGYRVCRTSCAPE